MLQFACVQQGTASPKTGSAAHGRHTMVGRRGPLTCVGLDTHACKHVDANHVGRAHTLATMLGATCPPNDHPCDSTLLSSVRHAHQSAPCTPMLGDFAPHTLDPDNFVQPWRFRQVSASLVQLFQIRSDVLQVGQFLLSFVQF